MRRKPPAIEETDVTSFVVSAAIAELADLEFVRACILAGIEPVVGPGDSPLYMIAAAAAGPVPS